LSEAPDILIDFSLPEALPGLVDFVKEHKSCVVSGTTGFNDSQFETFFELGKIVPLFWAANMSLGVHLMCELTEQLARYEKFFQFKIEEAHHVHKKDKPSGTALIIEQAARRSTSKIKPIESIREGEIFGIHRFIAESPLETLEVRHKALDRALFAQGALDVSLWLADQEPGVYTMGDFCKTVLS
ncbi:MAG: dihydrodipicolinate reductase C-terminal domain-containing protein, partial [Pseudomonadota bacterium]